MPFKTLIVHVEAEPSLDPRLALAVDLANHFGAKLLGVGAGFYRSPYYGGDGQEYAADAIDTAVASIAIGLKRAEEKFESLAQAVHQGSEWRTAVEFPSTELAAESRAADLVITSRSYRPGASDYSVAWPGALILESGRPVLVTPPDASHLDARRIVVAWKDTREARRAVSDALPFLQGAERVNLIEICESSYGASAAAARLGDVANHLLRHSIKTTVTVEVEEKDTTSAQQLLDYADRQKADLIVAGGYGHSRFQEWVFGGFTRALLAQNGRAVLFSH